MMIGRLLVWNFALLLTIAAIVVASIAPGTWLPAALLFAAVVLIARLLFVALNNDRRYKP